MVVVEFAIVMSKKHSEKNQEYRENTGNFVTDYENPVIVVLNMDYKYQFCNDLYFHNIVGLPF